MGGVTITELIDKMGLRNMTPELETDNVMLVHADVNRPALQLSGYFEHFEQSRVQIIGTVEYTYLQQLDEKKKEAVKNNVLRILGEKYDVEEEDFLSAELEVVPAGKSRESGLDASMIMAYGQDDRVCAYTSLVAMLEVENTEYTTCCLLVDKEEIGSVGATGMRSRVFENTVAEVLSVCGQYSDLALRRCLANSKMLSSDVSAAFDPVFASAYEKKNAAYFDAVWYLTNLPVPAENREVMMQMPNLWHKSQKTNKDLTLLLSHAAPIIICKSRCTNR
mgnify:CR=1 FL=1